MKDFIKQSYKVDTNNRSLNAKGIKSRFIDLKPNRNNQYVLTIKKDQLKNDNYRLTLNQGLLTLIMFKSVDLDKPIYSHHINLSDVSNYPYDDVVDIFDFRLPDQNYYLLHHEVVLSTGVLKVTLGKIHYN